MNRFAVVLTNPNAGRFANEESIMFLAQEDEHGRGADNLRALESRWLDEPSGRRLLGHGTFTLLLVAVGLAGMALCL
jgi:hypothetical protein